MRPCSTCLSGKFQRVHQRGSAAWTTCDISYGDITGTTWIFFLLWMIHCVKKDVSLTQSDHVSIAEVFYVIGVLWYAFSGKDCIWSWCLIYSLWWLHWHRYAGFGYLLYSHNNASAILTLRWYLNDRPGLIMMTQNWHARIAAAKSHSVLWIVGNFQSCVLGVRLSEAEEITVQIVGLRSYEAVFTDIKHSS